MYCYILIALWVVVFFLCRILDIPRILLMMQQMICCTIWTRTATDQLWSRYTLMMWLVSGVKCANFFCIEILFLLTVYTDINRSSSVTGYQQLLMVIYITASRSARSRTHQPALCCARDTSHCDSNSTVARHVTSFMQMNSLCCCCHLSVHILHTSVMVYFLWKLSWIRDTLESNFHS